MFLLFFDTETTGLWDKRLPCGHADQPKIAQLGAILADAETRKEVMRLDVVIFREDGIPPAASAIHGTTTERSQAIGVYEPPALDIFCDMVAAADMVIAHNIEFDVQIINNAARIYSGNAALDVFAGKSEFCTMKTATPVCRFPSKNGGGGYGWPKLELAIPHLLKRQPTEAHTAIGDVIDCRDLFFYLQDLITRPPTEAAA